MASNNRDCRESQREADRQPAYVATNNDVASVITKPATQSTPPDDQLSSESTDFSLDSMDTSGEQSSDSLLILNGANSSTDLPDEDASTGTTPESPTRLEVTVDLDDDVIRKAVELQVDDHPASGEPQEPSEPQKSGELQKSGEPQENESDLEQDRLKWDDQGLVTASSDSHNPPSSYRPTRRPPMGILCVFDDSSATYEEVRLRKTPFEVGRLDGDLVIAHELQMSRRHFRIERQQLKSDPATTDRSLAQWKLKDLESLNGTFIKKPQLMIRDQSEVLIGGELVRLTVTPANNVLELYKVSPGQGEEKVSLLPGEAWIGSDASCCVELMQGNPFIDPKHIRLAVDSRGRWSISDADSTNGLWVRVQSVLLQHGDQWQCGEQRFSIRLP